MDPAVGLAMYERGEILRTLGDLDGAAAAYDEAAISGHEPQLGLSLLWLAHGRTAAAQPIRRVLDEARDPVARSRRLGPCRDPLCCRRAPMRQSEHPRSWAHCRVLRVAALTATAS